MAVDEDRLTERFEENRFRLRAVAHRVLGSVNEADDAVQEAWLRLHHADTAGVRNLDAWLTTVVGRVCLDMLRSRRSRDEEPFEEYADAWDEHAAEDTAADPAHEALLGDSVGRAMTVVLDTLDPVERLAFVLHDMFAVPFTEIAPVVARSPAATRQLASRARRRVRAAGHAPDLPRQREVVDAFLSASREGEFEALCQLLAPGVVLSADSMAVRGGATACVEGAEAVARVFSGRARFARAELVDGAVGAVWRVGGHPKVVFRFTLDGGTVSAIDLLAEPGALRSLDLAPLRP